MKKEKKKRLHENFLLLFAFGLLFGACGLIDMRAWEIIAGAILASIGGMFAYVFDPSVDEPWHVQIDK